jgi:cob(I)alamin adenosyltransferase
MADSPQSPPPSARKKKAGLIIVHTGSGKGKTTAALGMAFRAVGQNMKVLMVQFIKGKWKYGELESARQLGNNLEIYPMGEGFTWNTRNRERDREKALEAFDFGLRKIREARYDMLIFDEINYVISYGYLPVQAVVEFLKAKPKSLHVILTGRDAAPEIIQLADLVTEMKEIKHPYQKGIKAQKGIEF